MRYPTIVGKIIAPRSRSIAKDYTLTLTATGLIHGIGILTGIITARLLGPAGKGDLATVLWLPSLMTMAGILGLPQAVAFEVSRNSHRDDILSATGFWLGLLIGIVEVALLYPLIPYILGPTKQHLIVPTRWFLFYIPLAFVGLTLLGVDQGRQHFVRYNILRLLPAIFYVIGLLFLWLVSKFNVFTVVLCNLLAQLIATVIRVRVAGQNLISFSPVSLINIGKHLIKLALKFHLPTITGIILMRTDMLLLIRLVPSEKIGYYSVAMAIAMVQTGVATSLVQVNFPKVAGTHDRSVNLMLHQFRIAQPIILLTAATIALLSPWVIRYLFGPAFLPASLPAFILIGALAIWGINQILDNGLRALGYGMPGTMANGIGLSVLIILGYILTSQYSILGMAVSVLLAQACVFITLILILRKHGKVVSWKELIMARQSLLAIYNVLRQKR